MNTYEIVSEFRQAMAAAGIHTSEQIVPDGNLCRFHVEGDRKGSKNGWAVLFSDSAAGRFGSWKTELDVTWSAKGARNLTPAERGRMDKKIQEDHKRREQELAERRAKGAELAREKWDSAQPAEASHPYLANKSVLPRGLKQADGILLVPVRDIDTRLHGLQRIWETGEKKFTLGTSKEGHFHFLGGTPTDRLIVVEGYATGATVHEATGDPVAVAFDAGNLRPVAEVLRGEFPGIELLIAGDNDHRTDGNPGRAAALDAAHAVNGSVAIPDLSGDQGTDWNDLLALRGLDAVRDGLDPAKQPSPTDWPDTPDVPGSPDPEPLPVDALPSVLREHAHSTAASIQIPEDPAGLLCLLCASAAVAGKYEILVDNSWRAEWSPLYGIAILASGERKSATFAEMVRPILEWEAERCAELLPTYRTALDVLEVRDKELDQVKRDVVSGKATIDEVEAARLLLEEARAKVPTLPRLLVGDATPEALVRRMADNNGRAALLSPEGDPLRIADGKYSDGTARLDELKKAWSGETLAPDRIGRDAAHVRRPVLTVGLTIQPSVLGTLRNARTMRGEGLFARFLFVRPDSLVGTRVNSGAAPPLDKTAASRYRNAIRVLLDSEPSGYEDDGTPIPHALGIDGQALQVLYAYMDELEAEKRVGGRLAGICDWAEKAHGQAVRVAALLELCERADDGRALFTEPISVTAMDSAVRIMRALTTHALAVFWEMSADSEQALLAYVLKKVRGLPKGSTLRDLHIAVRGKKSIDTIKDVRNLLDDLAERGCLRLRLRPPTGGQPPSPILEINPAILDTHTQQSQKSITSPSTETSVTSVRVNPVGTRADGDPAPNPEELSNDDVEYIEDERAGLRTEEPIEDAPVANGKGTPDPDAQTPSPELWEGPQEPDDTADRAEGVL